LTKSELSRETPHFPLPVVSERYAPGAGGNVAANLAALKPRSVQVLGVIGQDWRGDVLIRELDARGIDSSAIIRHPGRVTNAYIKPFRRGIADVEYEDPRLDFANHAPQAADLDEAVIATIDQLAGSVDIVCVSDQFANGCITDRVRNRLVRLAREGLVIIADSRYRIGLFQGCLLKPNELECALAVGVADPHRARKLNELADMARMLSKQAGSTICLTLGDRGCLLVEAKTLDTIHVPAVAVSPPLDICGAGDTFLSALATNLGSGTSESEAAYLANRASAVTIKKINQTGTATREEIMAVADIGTTNDTDA
ncbi:MAG: PfkB family carbohydrate kinase, partial [Bacillota bacterium]|nr:PfkB family carbohydrate kinase [Bacillota bacterium]